MKRLPEAFQHRRQQYTQLLRIGDIALFCVFDPHQLKTRLEVARIRRHNGYMGRGGHTVASEYYPQPQDWDKHGWTVEDEADGYALMLMLYLFRL